MEYKKITTITLKDVYGLNEKTLASIVEHDGYKIKEFRPPKLGDYYLSPVSLEIIYNLGKSIKQPCLIVEKTEAVISKNEKAAITVADVYGSDVTIPEGYRYVAFRLVKEDDLFISIHTQKVLVNDIFTDGCPRIIVEKI